MPWNEQKQVGRYEVLIKDKALHDATVARAERVGLSVGEYLQLLSRAVMLMEQGDPILASVLGVAPVVTAPAAPPPAAPLVADLTLVDRALDQMGL